MLVEETVTDIVDLEEFRRGIAMNSIATPVLPFGCIYYSEQKGDQTLCIMRRAEILDVNHANRHYKLALPDRLYTCAIRNGQFRRVFQHFMLGMPKSKKDMVFDAPFPNRVNNGALCQSGLMISPPGEKLPFRVDHVVNQVERTRYNTDHISYAKSAMPPLFSEGANGMYTRMLEKWKVWTEEHAENWEASLKEIPWRSTGDLESIMGGAHG